MRRLHPALLTAPVVVVCAVGCGSGDSGSGAVQQEQLDITTWVEGKPERGIATLAVQVTQDPALDVQISEPTTQGLDFTEVGQPEQERLGAQLVVTRRYRFSGEEGSYEIPAIEASTTLDDQVVTAASDPIWVDMGTEPVLPDGFADIEDPEPVFRLGPVLLIGAVCAGLTVLGGGGALGLGLWAFSGRKPRALPPEAPDVVALRRWNVVRADDALDDYDKAVALAGIFREYVEAVLSFPATAWTTSEILAHLDRLTHLPEGNVGRAKRILRATDRIKFADAAARETLFEELDDALRTFVASTRPRSWEGDT